jgi:uncharacterized protein YndB with AHSA1/START domain
MTFPARHISVSIDRPPAEVYAFASNPENLPQWAAGLSGGSIEQVDGEWISESPMGRVRIAFAKQNEYGVLDHDVTLPSGETFHNPMRVVPNDNGSELSFTLFHRASMSDEDFERDAATVHDDLLRLKGILEA